MAFIVVYRHKTMGGPPSYCGGPGTCVNTGRRKKYSTVMSRKNALRFPTEAAAKRQARNHNAEWTGKVEEVSE